MNRTKATAAFDAYVSNYDPDNPMIHLKVVHSYKVAEIAERIARSLSNEELVDFAWLLGLLHDIGRFEQVRRYDTFVDSQSVDHAELGADILFKENLIDRFPTETLPEGWRETAETAIRQHNKLASRNRDPSAQQACHCRRIGRADEDIFRNPQRCGQSRYFPCPQRDSLCRPPWERRSGPARNGRGLTGSYGLCQGTPLRSERRAKDPLRQACISLLFCL